MCTKNDKLKIIGILTEIMIINFGGKKFYPYYTGEPALEQSRCVVQKENKNGYYYASFVSWEYFQIWYASINPAERTFFEIIREGPQKFRIDIDCRKTEFDEAGWYAALRTISQVLISTGIPHDDILVYESKHASKYSSHIVVKNVYFETSHHCVAFLNIILDRMPKHLRPIVDQSVYKTLQGFRIEGSMKYNKYNYKYLLSFAAESVQCRSTVSMHFLDGLISNTKGCQKCRVPTLRTENYTLNENRTLNDNSMLNTNFTLNNIGDLNKNFSIYKRLGNLILLKRKSPSECIICKRVHSNENPYLLVVNNAIYFNCRRCKKDESIRIF